MSERGTKETVTRAGYVPVKVEVLEQAIEAMERAVRFGGGYELTLAIEALRAVVQGEGTGK